jgi:hypothetical protein
MSNDMLSDGVEWLADQMLSKMFRDTEYQQAGGNAHSVKSTTGRTMFRVVEDGVSKVVWTDRDFIYRKTDLLAIGVTEPALGDKIREINTVGDTTLTRVYVVSAPSGEQPYKNADGRDVLIRVHTKLDCEEYS